MDPILIAIISAIVIAIGYILSRPFFSVEQARHLPPATSEHVESYRKLLQDIKKIESAYAAGELLEEAYQQQLTEKKQQAAAILRQMDAGAVSASKGDKNKPAQQAAESPTSDYSADNAAEEICPHCGSMVTSDDKFCAHCGKALSS